MRMCISPELDLDSETCRTCLYEGTWNDMPCHVPDNRKEDGYFLLDVSYTMTNLCDIISRKLGCTKCLYFDAETHNCDVRKQINDLKEKAEMFIKG